jgi:thiamine transport system permease protein
MTRRTSHLAFLWILPLAFLALFYFYPLGSILAVSFERGQGGPAFQLLEAFASPSVRRILAFTIGQAALSTLLTLLVGLPARTAGAFRLPGKSLFKRSAASPSYCLRWWLPQL